MKNQISIRAIIPLFALILLTTTSKAQVIENRIGFDGELNNDFIVQYFKVKEISNTLYFKFLILENSANTAYVLESSNNGLDFKSVKVKRGFKSPNNVPLLYCYSVDMKFLTARVYRIKRVSPIGITYSSIIKTINDGIPSLTAQLSF